MRPRHAFIVLSLLPLLLLPWGARAAPARQFQPIDVKIAVEPPVMAPGGSTTVALKNFNWNDSGRARATARAGEASVPVTEGAILLGPRRRANVPVTLPSPGVWIVEVQTTALFEDVPAVQWTNVIVATAGSTTGGIALDQTVQGSIQPDPAWEDGGGLGGWTFELAEGQTVIIQAQSQGAGALELNLLDDQGMEYASGQGLIANKELPAGRYLLAVTSEAAVSYSLTLSPGLSGDSEGGPIELGTTLPGLLAPADDADEWTFDAAPGDVVYAAMTAAEQGLDSYLELLDPAGNVVAFNDDRDGFNAALSYVVPVAGAYTVRATSNAGGSQGSYSLEVAADPEMTRLEPLTLTALGRQTQGRVATGGAQAWRFQANAGDAIGLLAVSRSRDFDAKMTLYGPDGSQIALSDDDGGNLNPLINTTAPDDGYYTAVVGSYDGAAGDYDLTLAGEPIATPTP